MTRVDQEQKISTVRISCKVNSTKVNREALFLDALLARLESSVAAWVGHGRRLERKVPIELTSVSSCKNLGLRSPPVEK